MLTNLADCDLCNLFIPSLRLCQATYSQVLFQDCAAKVAVANAEAEAIAKVAAAIGKSDISPANYMLAEKYIGALEGMTSGKDTRTVYMPYDASAMLSSIGSIKELFKESETQRKDK